jgi:hypothetical protein
LRQSQAGKGFRGDHRLREKQRILIVDDDYLIAAFLAKVLEAAGRQVDVSEVHDEAFESPAGEAAFVGRAFFGGFYLKRSCSKVWGCRNRLAKRWRRIKFF